MTGERIQVPEEQAGQTNIMRRAIQAATYVQRTLRSVRSTQQNNSSVYPVPVEELVHHPHAVWFDITLEDEYRRAVQEVCAGQSYTLAITGSLTRSATSLHAEEIYILEEIILRWNCATDVNDVNKSILKLDIKDEIAILKYAEAVSFRREYILPIPADFPTCTLVLELTYTLPEKNGSLGQRRIPVRGSYTPENTLWFTTLQLAEGLPEEVAILAVSSHPYSQEEGTFQVRGWHRYTRSFTENATTRTVISVARMMQHKDPPLEILGKMRRFSNRVPQALKEWLLALYKKYRTNLCIIIIDGTTLEIPWELLEFEGEPDIPERYLGTFAKVVRWLPREHTMRPSLLHIYPQEHSGSVVAYLDNGLGRRETAAEEQTFRTLSIKRFNTLRELETHIQKPLTDVGLIYIGCHGEEGKTLQQQIADRRLDALTSIRLELIDPHQEPRPTVFINACESARIMRDDKWDDSSFVDVLLRRCANGFIGTIGRVGTTDASLIARAVLERIRQPEGEQIAEILRHLRAKAVRDWLAARQEGATHDKLAVYEYTVIYTFMYVYYGNPLARLRLYTIEKQTEERP